MKQKKLQFAVLFFPALFALALLPTIVLAQTGQTLGQLCNSTTVPCQAALVCDTTSSICVDPNKSAGGGVSCGALCQCIRSVSVKDEEKCCSKYPNDPDYKAYYCGPGDGGAGGGTGGNGGGSGGDLCGTGFTKENGICLPNSPVNGGLASSKSLTDLIGQVLKILLGFAGVIAVVLVVIGGFQYMTSSGNEELAEKGKKTLINAIIGLVVVVLAYTLVNVLIDLITKTPT